MALCIVLQPTLAGGPSSALSTPGAYTVLPWSLGDATKTGTQYACPTGTHLLLTVEEVNAPPQIPLDAGDVAQAYAWGISAVIVLWSVGFVVGLIVNTIKKG